MDLSTVASPPASMQMQVEIAVVRKAMQLQAIEGAALVEQLAQMSPARGGQLPPASPEPSFTHRLDAYV